MSYLITFTEAENLISNFVNHATLGPIAQKNSLGGTIDKNSFQTQVSNPGFETGKMAWYCWNEDGSAPYHSFFLSFEQFNNFTSSPYPGEPEHASLQAPKKIFKYSAGQSINDLLKNHQEVLANPINQGISKGDVQLHIKDFNLDFPKDSSGNAFNQEPFGFINSDDPGGGEKSDWELFLSQPGLVAIRYYFGLDESLSVNKIRIICIGVDTNGENMIPVDVNNALIIDKTRP